MRKEITTIGLLLVLLAALSLTIFLIARSFSQFEVKPMPVPPPVVVPAPIPVSGPQDNRFIKLPNVPDKNFKLRLGQKIIVAEYDLEIKVSGIGQGWADLDLNYSGRETYGGQVDKSGNNGYVPNPNNYPNLAGANLLDYAKTLYRTHRLCTGEINPNSGWLNGKAVKDLSGGYKNFTGASRFYEQCIADGSFDSYYDERCDYGIVRFNQGETKRGADFAVTLKQVDSQGADIEVTCIDEWRYKPANIEN